MRIVKSRQFECLSRILATRFPMAQRTLHLEEAPGVGPHPLDGRRQPQPLTPNNARLERALSHLGLGIFGEAARKVGHSFHTLAYVHTKRATPTIRACWEVYDSRTVDVAFCATNFDCEIRPKVGRCGSARPFRYLPALWRGQVRAKDMRQAFFDIHAVERRALNQGALVICRRHSGNGAVSSNH